MKSAKENTLVVIVGPTAVGKTNVAIDVAKFLNAEIISCDSRQFYKEMKIGTAVPSQEELAEVPHHFIQQLSVLQDYSAGDFERDALLFMHEYFAKNKVLVMTGGSGLFEKAVTEGLDDFPDIPSEIREKLNQDLQENGIEFLQNELQEKDSECFKNVDTQNPRRLIRALEVIRFTGDKFSKFTQKNVEVRNFKIIKIGLERPREELYRRINRRVDLMIDQGLLNEVESLFEHRNLNALRTVGYRELFDFIEGKIPLNIAIDEIKKHSRRYAKRQMTWYRRDKDIVWFSPNEPDKIIDFLNKEIAE